MRHVITHPTLIDPATGAPLRAITMTTSGRPVWPILGGSEDGGDAAPEGAGDADAKGESKPEGDKPEDDRKFTQADLDRAISQRIAREQAKYADYEAHKAAAAELAQLKEANSTELEKAVSQARKAGAAEVTERVNARLVAAEARAAAAALNFHNPSDAVGLVDLKSIKVSSDGDIDSDAVKALISDLAKSQPYLVKTDPAPQDKPVRPKADPSQGPRGGGTGSAADQFAAALGPLLA